MYVSNQINHFRIRWNDICTHTYRRVSRSKWEIHLSYACGAKMSLDKLPDDLIQCLVLGAFNSRKDIESNLKTVSFQSAAPAGALATWTELQPLLLEE